MNEKEWLLRIEALEREQRQHYAEGREPSGDAVGEAIRFLICEGRVSGFCLPDGRPASPVAEPPSSKPPRRKPAP